MDEWLHKKALPAQNQGSTSVHVFLDEDGEVVAYIALSIHEVYSFNVPNRVRTGGKKIPGILLGKLALARTYRGQGYGSYLLLEALKICLSGSTLLGGRVVLVDMRNKGLTNFYESHNFLPLNNGQPLRRYMRMPTVKKLVEEYEGALLNLPPA